MNKNIKKMLVPIIGIILFGLIIFMITIIVKTVKMVRKKQISTEINTINAITDTGITKRNSDSSTTITQQVIENLDVKSLLAIKDKKIADLQNQVKNDNKKYNELLSVTIFDAEDKSHIVTKTIVHDTIEGQLPVYESIFSLGLDTVSNIPWVSGSTIATWDTTIIDLKIHNSFSLSLGRDKKGITYGDLISNNPYTETKNLRIYNVTLPQQSKWGWQVTGGGGIFTGFDGNIHLGVGVIVGFGKRLSK